MSSAAVVAPDAPPNFEDMLALEKEVLAPEAQEPSPTEPPPPVEPPPEPEPKPEPEVKPEAKPEEKPKPEEPPKRPVVPPEKILTEEEVLAQRNKALEQIAGRFQFSEDDQALLISEPHKVLPKLAAELQLSTYELVLGALQGLLPGLIGSHIQTLQNQGANSNRFFDRWPALKDPKYHDTIREVSQRYRVAFPNASVDEAIEEIGALVSTRMGAPTTPKSPASVPTPAAQPKPFMPAGTGAAAVPASASSALADEEKMWADLVKD